MNLDRAVVVRDREGVRRAFPAVTIAAVAQHQHLLTPDQYDLVVYCVHRAWVITVHHVQIVMADNPPVGDGKVPAPVQHALDQLAAVRTAIEDMGLPALSPQVTRERVAALAEQEA